MAAHDEQIGQRTGHLYQLKLDPTDDVGCLRLCGCRQWSCRHEFLLGQGKRVKKGLYRSFAKAPASLVWPALVVVGEPSIEIGLQIVDCAIDLLAERHPIELVEHGAVKPLADSIGLWVTFPRKSGHRVTRIWPLPAVG